MSAEILKYIEYSVITYVCSMYRCQWHRAIDRGVVVEVFAWLPDPRFLLIQSVSLKFIKVNLFLSGSSMQMSQFSQTKVLKKEPQGPVTRNLTAVEKMKVIQEHQEAFVKKGNRAKMILP